MGRAPCCDKIGLKKGPWTAEEDQKLTAYINENGHGSWRSLPKEAGLLRCGKSCRLRWTNYLRPDIKRGEFTSTEEQTIIQLHALLGNRWSSIAAHLPKRTDNEIKNYWNTHLKKRLIKMGLDPITHKPRPDSSSGGSPVDTADCSANSASNPSHNSTASHHMAQWESVRREAEARLAREAEMRAKGLWPVNSPFSSPTTSAATTATTTASSSAAIANLSPTSILSPLSIISSPQSAATTASRPAPKIDPESKPHIALLTCDPESPSHAASKTNVTAVELMNAIHNWEKSLQGQAGLMWPDSWRSSHPRILGESSANAGTNTGIEVGHESSSSSSPLKPSNDQHHLLAGSPTSTLCSLDRSPKQIHSTALNTTATTTSTTTSDEAMPTKRLSWSNTIHPYDAHNSLLLGSDLASTLDQHASSVSDDTSSFSSCFNTLLDMDVEDVCPRGSKTDTFHEAFEGDLKACPNLVDLASVTNSSSLLGEFELTSKEADMCSSHYSSNIEDEEHPISYGVLLNDEEYDDCDWNSMLKEVGDSDTMKPPF